MVLEKIVRYSQFPRGGGTRPFRATGGTPGAGQGQRDLGDGDIGEPLLRFPLEDQAGRPAGSRLAGSGPQRALSAGLALR